MLNMKQVVDIMRNTDPNDALQNPDLSDYQDAVLNAGRNALKDLDEMELLGAVTLVQASAIENLMMTEPKLALFFMANDQLSTELFATLLRVAVGISVVEDWR